MSKSRINMFNKSISFLFTILFLFDLPCSVFPILPISNSCVLCIRIIEVLLTTQASSKRKERNKTESKRKIRNLFHFILIHTYSLFLSSQSRLDLMRFLGGKQQLISVRLLLFTSSSTHRIA